ncbi:MAG: hypothetical protein ACT4UP_03390 [Gammaproteobacteria bacterium]
MNPKLRAGLLTVLAGALIGFFVLGVGGRLAMHAIARIATGSGAFTLGGTSTVIGLGAAAGALAGLLLFAARTLFARWSPVPALLFWAAVLAGTLAELDLRDPLELALFVPIGVAFGALLQASSWRWRRFSHG